MNTYYLVHKPFNVLSAFTSTDGKENLKDYFNIPSNAYPVGRLDYDSEGLLIISDDKKLNAYLLNPSKEHEREYWVQVEGNISNEAIEELRRGVFISVNGKKHFTKKCVVQKFEVPPEVSERNPPIRTRKFIPDSWVKIILTEGKNRQVRKMTAKTGYPTLRLIRYRIENITLSGLLPGEMKIISQSELYNLLKIIKDK